LRMYPAASMIFSVRYTMAPRTQSSMLRSNCSVCKTTCLRVWNEYESVILYDGN
jgi:hypothetical protein